MEQRWGSEGGSWGVYCTQRRCCKCSDPTMGGSMEGWGIKRRAAGRCGEWEEWCNMGWTLVSIPRTSQRLDKFYEGEVSNDIKLAFWKIYPKCCVEWRTEGARSGCGPTVHAEALWLSRWMLRVVWTEMLLICSQYFQRIHSQSQTERFKMKFWLHFVELGIQRNDGTPIQHLVKGPLQERFRLREGPGQLFTCLWGWL